jgi:hypothetical protein
MPQDRVAFLTAKGAADRSISTKEALPCTSNWVETDPLLQGMSLGIILGWLRTFAAEVFLPSATGDRVTGTLGRRVQPVAARCTPLASAAHEQTTGKDARTVAFYC